MQTSYDIRAEFPNSTYRDFRVAGETLADAKPKAEAHLRAKHSLGFDVRFDWRGAVVFVGFSPKV